MTLLTQRVEAHTPAFCFAMVESNASEAIPMVSLASVMTMWWRFQTPQISIPRSCRMRREYFPEGLQITRALFPTRRSFAGAATSKGSSGAVQPRQRSLGLHKSTESQTFRTCQTRMTLLVLSRSLLALFIAGVRMMLGSKV